MTRKKLAEEAETITDAIVEQQPQHGGSYIRDPESGALTRVEGPEIATHEPAEPELVPPTGDDQGGGVVQQQES